MVGAVVEAAVAAVETGVVVAGVSVVAKTVVEAAAPTGRAVEEAESLVSAMVLPVPSAWVVPPSSAVLPQAQNSKAIARHSATIFFIQKTSRRYSYLYHTAFCKKSQPKRKWRI